MEHFRIDKDNCPFYHEMYKGLNSHSFGPWDKRDSHKFLQYYTWNLFVSNDMKELDNLLRGKYYTLDVDYKTHFYVPSIWAEKYCPQLIWINTSEKYPYGEAEAVFRSILNIINEYLRQHNLKEIDDNSEYFVDYLFGYLTKP